MATILERLVEAVRKAADYNSAAEVAPSCILWTDGDRQFEEALPLLRAALPELLTLGEYDAETRTGPAIWLRCALGGTVDGYDPKASTPRRCRVCSSMTCASRGTSSSGTSAC